MESLVFKKPFMLLRMQNQGFCVLYISGIFKVSLSKRILISFFPAVVGQITFSKRSPQVMLVFILEALYSIITRLFFLNYLYIFIHTCSFRCVFISGNSFIPEISPAIPICENRLVAWTRVLQFLIRA